MDIRPHPVKPPLERFMALIRVSTEHFHLNSACWDWQGAKSGDGYGQFVLDGRRSVKKVRIAPYRFIWEYFHGRPMPHGLEPDHLCNRRACCNPQHIEPVTHSENQRRSYLRGRRCAPGRPRPSHCPHGHEYTSENAAITPKGAIQCRACNRARCAAYQARKRTSNG